MSDINWNEAPAWATKVMSSDFEINTNTFVWANEEVYSFIGAEAGFDRYFKFKHTDLVFSLVEKRPAIIISNDPIDILSEDDMVNNPEHYKSDGGIECIDAIRAALGKDGFISHCRGTAIKYAWRSGKKANHAEDLRKAAWYLEKAASELEK